MILGVGCDIIEIQRIRRAIAKHGDRILHHLFTSTEIDYCGRRDASFAGRFVAKEALVKALGCGIGRLCSWTDIEVYNDCRGKPCVRWSPEVISHFNIVRTHLSISHSDSMAIAYAIVETADAGIDQPHRTCL